MDSISYNSNINNIIKQIVSDEEYSFTKKRKRPDEIPSSMYKDYIEEIKRKKQRNICNRLLQVACKEGRIYVLKQLLSEKNLHYKNSQYQSLPIIALLHKQYKALEFIIDRGYNHPIEILKHACVHNDITAVSIIFKKYMHLKLNTMINYHRLLNYACFDHNENTVNIVKMLLDHGAKVNIPDSCGITALHDACLEKDYSTMLILIKSGAENAKDNSGRTPLQLLGLDTRESQIYILTHAMQCKNAESLKSLVNYALNTSM
jgi:hypothetical protein